MPKGVATDTKRVEGQDIAEAGARTVAVPGTPILSSGPLGWNGVIAERFRHSSGEYLFPVYPQDTVTLYLGGPMRSVRWSADGVHEGHASKGAVTVKVSGQPAGWRIDEAADLLCVRFAPVFLGHVAEENDLDPGAVELRPGLDERDEAAKYVGLAMLAEMESGGASGRVYGDALATALATHLLRNHAASPQGVSERGGGLPRSDLRRVTDFVNDHLSEDLGLPEMAGVANLSQHHFSRQFKRSTGLPPHRYVIGRRVERARELLSGTDLPVGDVAGAVGFANQSHLALHFRRHFGVAPSALRR